MSTAIIIVSGDQRWEFTTGTEPVTVRNWRFFDAGYTYEKARTYALRHLRCKREALVLVTPKGVDCDR